MSAKMVKPMASEDARPTFAVLSRLTRLKTKTTMTAHSRIAQVGNASFISALAYSAKAAAYNAVATR